MNHRANADRETKSGYTMEELLPIVGKLAEKYTSYEHTSVSYETAEMLMEAVLYCIREAETGCPAWETGALSAGALSAGVLSAEQAYTAGAAAVRAKVSTALRLYNEIIPTFNCYENRLLFNTFSKEMPEFFKWYDVRFRPQDTILTLDYPVLRDLSEYTGIDRIYEYILCIGLEQEFLSLFPEAYVNRVLTQNSEDVRDITENLCEIVLTHLAKCFLSGKTPLEPDFRTDHDSKQESGFPAGDGQSLQDLRKMLQDWLTAFLQTRCHNRSARNDCDGKCSTGSNCDGKLSAGSDCDGKAARLTDYLSVAVNDIAVRLTYTRF